MDPYDFSVAKVQEAGAMLLAAGAAGHKAQEKSGNARDLVTATDKKVSKFLVSEIKKQFPKEAVYSEEDERDSEPKGKQWAIDPVDGTSNFSRGIPHFAVSLGLLEDGVPTAGAVYNPVTKELFSFRRGGGAFLNGSPIKVSPVSDLQKGEVLFSGGGRDPKVWEWGSKMYGRLLSDVGKRGLLGCSSLDLCFVAAGRVEGLIYGTLTTLDVAAAFGILMEAGGVASGPDGGPVKFLPVAQKIYAANSPAVLQSLLALGES